jgi:hypothetical protein
LVKGHVAVNDKVDLKVTVDDKSTEKASRETC